MRVHVVSDVHGADEALARAADDADLFICLGDLILFLDYADPSRGIYADLFGTAHTTAFIEARTAGRYEEAREISAAAWQRMGIVDPSDRRGVLLEHVATQYEQLFRAMPDQAMLTYGNVDIPDMWPRFLKAGHQVLDGQVIEVGGLRMGFVGGGVVSPMRTPYELTVEEFTAKVEGLGPVDVLFSHIPPALPGLTYDVVARRFEFGSDALLEYVRRHQPLVHLFGHVHQPQAARTRIGRTECVNVGHFAASKRPFVLDL